MGLRSLVLVLGTAVVAGAAGFFGKDLLPEDVAGKLNLFSPTSSATPAPLPANTVSAYGRLEPADAIIDVSAPTGSRLDRLAEGVREDAFVKKEQPLAYLDNHAELAVARAYAASQLQEAQKRLEAETTYGQALIEEARQRLKQVEEVTPLAIRAQEAEVRRSAAELAKARLDLKRSQQMLGDAAVSQSQNDAVALVVRQAEEQLLRNQATLEQLTRDQQIKLRQAQAALLSAEAGLTRAQLATQTASLEQALKLAEARLDRTVIRAPGDGQVLKVLTRAGETVGRNPILKLGDTRRMVAVAEVYETDVGRVRPGQPATIKSKAFPGVTLSGKVERVGSLIRKNDVLGIDPTADADARVLEVRVRLDDPQVAARYNNLQVDVYILVSGE